MFLMSAMTVLCTAGVVFYVRFLLALCKECSLGRSGYWVRLSTREAKIVELRSPEGRVMRAA